MYQLIFEEEILLILKNFPGRLILKHFHVISWEMAKRALSPLLKGDAWALRGYLTALGSLGRILRQRREVQRRRNVPKRYIEGILRENRSVIKEINLSGRPVEELP